MKWFLLLLFSSLAVFGQASNTGNSFHGPLANRLVCSANVSDSNSRDSEVHSNADDRNTYKCYGGSWSEFARDGATPNRKNVDSQKKEGSDLSTSPINDNKSVVNISEDKKFTDPNPYYDIRRYGARAENFAAYASTTANCTTGSKRVTLASPIDLVTGDGIAIAGCGPATSLSTPPAPTVRPKGMSGTTKYDYQIIAVDKKGGYTVASSTGSTLTGPTTLGINTCNISSTSSSAGTITVNTYKPCPVLNGAMVSLQSTADPTANIYSVVTRVNSGTEFTVVTANNASSSGGAGGIVVVWTYNDLVITTVANADFYIVYGRTAGSFAFVDTTPAGQYGSSFHFRDYGSVAMGNQGLPWYIPSTPPALAGAQYLSSTISSGAGTTSIVLANSAGSNASGATVRHDNAPALNAAYCAAQQTNGGGTVYIPIATEGMQFKAFHFWTRLILGASCRWPQGGQILQGSYLLLHAPLQLPNGLIWTGIPGSHAASSNPSFGFGSVARIQGEANPLFLFSNSTANRVEHVSLSSNVDTNANPLVLSQNNTTNLSFYDDDIGTGGTAALETGILIKDGFNFYLDKVSFGGGNVSSAVPPDDGMLKFGAGDGPTHAMGGDATANELNFTGRGITFDMSIAGAGCGGCFDLRRAMYQSGLNPFMVFEGAYSSSGNILVDHFDNADYGAQFMANFALIFSGVQVRNSSGGPAPFTSGYPIRGLYLDLSNGAILAGPQANIGPYISTVNYGQNTNLLTRDFGTGLGDSSGTNQSFLGLYEPALSAGQNITQLMAIPPAPVAVTPLGRGGSLASGHTWNVRYTALDIDGAYINVGQGETRVSANTVASRPTVFNDSLSIAFTPTPGAAGYRFFLGNGCDPASCGPSFIKFTTQLTSPYVVTNNATVNGPGGGAVAGSLNTAGTAKISKTGTLEGLNLSLAPVTAPTGYSGFTQFYTDSRANWPSFKPNGNKAYVIPGISVPIVNGHNLCADGTSGAYVDCLTTKTIASGTATLGTNAVAGKACATVVTSAATDVTTTDAVSYSFNAAPSGAYTTGLVIESFVTPGNVNFLVCNPTTEPLKPPAETLNWRVAR